MQESSAVEGLVKMKKLAFGLVLALFNWFGLELAAFILLWIWDGAPSSPHEMIAQRAMILAGSSERSRSLAEAQEAELTRLARGGSEEEVLHPYLGYVINPEINQIQHRQEKGRLLVSELGFFEPPDGTQFPSSAGDAIGPPPLRVGIFGGSVAFIFSFVSRDKLAGELASLSGVRGRPIAIRSFALGGYKQPQQLQALTYLLALGEKFDLVINIDGFNDIVLPYVQNLSQQVCPFYPSNWAAKVGQLPDPTLENLRGRVAYFRDLRRQRALFFSRRAISRSYLTHLLWRLQDSRLTAAISSAELATLHHTPPARQYLTHGPARHYSDDAETFRDLAAVWRRSSLQMHRLCEANGIRYFHFLQPNQYVPGSKTLSAEERWSAFDPHHPYRAAVAAGYPFLAEAGKELRAAGVRFYDLTEIYKAHPETVYFDTCCHFNQHGNDLLAVQIADRLGTSFQPNESGPPSR